jgi:hypothetical protein
MSPTTAIADDALRVARHRALDLLDRRYDLIHQIRREPIKAVGYVFGAGVLVGAIAGAACVGLGLRRDHATTRHTSG